MGFNFSYLKGYDTNDATILAADVPSGKIGYGKNGRIVGTMNMNYPFKVYNVPLPTGSVTPTYVTLTAHSSLVCKVTLQSSQSISVAADTTGSTNIYRYAQVSVPSGMNKIMGVRIKGSSYTREIHCFDNNCKDFNCYFYNTPNFYVDVNFTNKYITLYYTSNTSINFANVTLELFYT